MDEDVVERRNQAFLRIDRHFHTGFLAVSLTMLTARISNPKDSFADELALVALCISLPLLAGYLLASSTDEFAILRPARKLRDATSKIAVATSIVGLGASVYSVSAAAAGAFAVAGIIAWALSVKIAKANFGEHWEVANDEVSPEPTADQAA